MKNRTIALILCVLFGATCFAQDKYKVEIKNDTKIIHVDALGLPGTMAILEVMRMLPEILNRPSTSIFSNYDVQINGFSVGDSKEQFLSQTYLADVITIEIVENSVSSYQNKGQGGSLNFIMRELKDGPSGKLNLDADTSGDIQPTFQFNYKKKKFSLYTWAAYSLSRPAYSLEKSVQSDSDLSYTSDTTWAKYDYQMLRLYMDYKPTDKDVMSVQVFQTFSKLNKDFSHGEQGSYIVRESFKNDRSFSVAANLKYEHKFTNSKLTVEARYNYSPVSNEMKYGSNRFYAINNWGRGLSGKVGYSYDFTPKGIMKSGNIGTGVNFNFNNDTNTRYEEFMPGFGDPIKSDINMDAKSSFFSPYLNTEWALGNWRLKLSAEYQHYNYNLKKDYSFEKPQRDFTAKLMVGWQVAEHHHLRLMLDRKIRRPDNYQVYPYVIYDAVQRFNFKGDPDLMPELSNEVSLDYITDHKTKDGDFFMLNLNASYQHVDNIFGVKAPPYQAMVIEEPYKLYVNNGLNDIFKASAMLLYSVGRLSISLSGNLFNNNTLVDGVADHYTYYSLAILPSMGFRNNWSVTASAMYSSPVNTNQSELGQSAFVHLRLSKSWQTLVVSLEGMLPLSSKATDLTFDAANNFSIRRYSPYTGYVGISCSWQF